jgi:hypothetical protein
MADAGATVAEALGVAAPAAGASFLETMHDREEDG